MRARDHAIHVLASKQRNLITLAQVIEVGASAQYAAENARRKRWQRMHDGVWLIGHAKPDFRTKVLAAVLAAGPAARASSRSPSRSADRPT